MRHLCLGEIEGSYHFCVPKRMWLGGEAVFCLSGGLLSWIQKEARQTGALLPGDGGLRHRGTLLGFLGSPIPTCPALLPAP